MKSSLCQNLVQLSRSSSQFSSSRDRSRGWWEPCWLLARTSPLQVKGPHVVRNVFTMNLTDVPVLRLFSTFPEQSP